MGGWVSKNHTFCLLKLVDADLQLWSQDLEICCAWRLWKTLELLWKSLEIFGNPWKSLEIIGNPWKSVGNPYAILWTCFVDFLCGFGACILVSVVLASLWWVFGRSSPGTKLTVPPTSRQSPAKVPPNTRQGFPRLFLEMWPPPFTRPKRESHTNLQILRASPITKVHKKDHKTSDVWPASQTND